MLQCGLQGHPKTTTLKIEGGTSQFGSQQSRGICEGERTSVQCAVILGDC